MSYATGRKHTLVGNKGSVLVVGPLRTPTLGSARIERELSLSYTYAKRRRKHVFFFKFISVLLIAIQIENPLWHRSSPFLVI